MRWAIALALLCGLGLALTPAQAVEEAVVRASPMAALDRDVDPTPIEAEVVEALDAGPYRYLRVAGPSGEGWWVGLDKGSEPGERVRLKAIGRARDFESGRLQRRFDALMFGVVTPI